MVQDQLSRVCCREGSGGGCSCPAPLPPATPAPCPPYQGPRAASPVPPIRSLPRAAYALSGPRAAAEALGAAGPGARSCGGQARSGRPVCGGLGRPTASAACHVLTHPLTSPTSTHRSTLYSPGFSSRAAECPLPPMAPLQGGSPSLATCGREAPSPSCLPLPHRSAEASPGS